MAIRPSTLKALPSLTLKGHVVEQVRNAILTGEYEPGERLNETQLARQFKVSRIPVREALGQLEEQGLVMNKPRRGMFVIALSDDDVQMINSLRILLEAEAIKLCQTNMTPTTEKQLVSLVEKMDQRGQRTEFDASALDLEFHRAIWSCGGNLYLAKTLNSLVTMLFAHQALTYWKDKAGPKWPLNHHRVLLDVVLGVSDVAPEVAMVNHLRVRYTNPERFCSFTHHRGANMFVNPATLHKVMNNRRKRSGS
jgi:DNA-binding GntR family transcriptional regulator